MKSYPYIGELKNGTGGVVLFARDSYGAQLNCKGKNWENKDTSIYGGDDWDEDSFKNITAEYLANTYGEVKSKEHAEFIVKLCENAGIDVFLPIHDVNHFVIKEKLSFHNCKSITTSELKQITIPLPPECESVDEWPKVGSSVELGHTGKGEVKSLSDGFAWIKLDNKDYTTVYVSSLRKPQTPEQELNEELYELCLTHCDSKFQASEIARKLIDKYNITKKGEGDD